MFREAGMEFSPVSMSCPSPKTTVPPCLPLCIKDSLKEDARLLFLALCFLLKAFWFWLSDGESCLNVGGFGREKDY
jgi:hypothetical protein